MRNVTNPKYSFTVTEPIASIYDAEVTPNTGIKYVRDVNIVVANLEAAIASITEG